MENQEMVMESHGKVMEKHLSSLWEPCRDTDLIVYKSSDPQE